MSNVKTLLATLTHEVKDEGKESRPKGITLLGWLDNIDSQHEMK